MLTERGCIQWIGHPNKINLCELSAYICIDILYSIYDLQVYDFIIYDLAVCTKTSEWSDGDGCYNEGDVQC